MMILFTWKEKISLQKQMTSSFAAFLIGADMNSSKQGRFYKEGKSQKLNKQEADERNQDKKAIAADS